VSKTLAYALTITGFAAAAQAGDLDLGSIKDPLPDTLTWQGVTLYGTIDVGYGYQSHGAPTNGDFRQDAVYNIYSSKFANKSYSGLESQAAEQSFVGLIVEEPVAPGLKAVARLETSFDPLYGVINDGPKSLLENAGTPLSQQSANADSSRAGQAFNGPAYGGVASDTYGTLSIGRHTSIQGDVFREYDPQDLSNAFSLLRWSSALAGAGVTESSNLDNSIKYRNQIGPVHVAGIYSTGGPDTGFFGPAYGANVGGAYRGFSLDTVYQKVNAGAQASADTVSGLNVNAAPAAGQFSNTLVKALIADSDSWSVQGKYTFEFGGGYKDGGYKDDASGGPQLTVYGGFEDIQYYNSSLARDEEYVGQTIAGGYTIGNPTLLNAGGLKGSFNYYVGTRELEVAWTGATYALASGWTFSAGYYHIYQPAYSSLSKPGTPQPGSPNQQAGYTAGSLNDGSFVVDYRFDKHFDVYAGVNYSAIDGGLASGYLANNDTSVVSGVRLKF
jgi:Gram-negative porin